MSIETLYIPPKNSDTFIKQGDTIGKIEFVWDDATVDWTQAEIKMQIKDKNGKIVISLSNGSRITVESSVKWVIDERSKDDPILPHGELKGDIQYTYEGKTKTIYDVEYNILKQTTV